MDQRRQQAQRAAVDVRCLELRWINKAIGHYCTILNLNAPIAKYTLRTFRRTSQLRRQVPEGPPRGDRCLHLFSLAATSNEA